MHDNSQVFWLQRVWNGFKWFHLHETGNACREVWMICDVPDVWRDSYLSNSTSFKAGTISDNLSEVVFPLHLCELYSYFHWFISLDEPSSDCNWWIVRLFRIKVHFKWWKIKTQTRVIYKSESFSLSCQAIIPVHCQLRPVSLVLEADAMMEQRDFWDVCDHIRSFFFTLGQRMNLAHMKVLILKFPEVFSFVLTESFAKCKPSPASLPVAFCRIKDALNVS